MKPPEILETTRLRLRPTRSSDASFIFESYAQDHDVTRYLTWLPHRSIEETHAFLERCVRSWREASAFPWLIEKKHDATPLGMIELRMNSFRADIGYVLARPYWGHGFMPEALIAVRVWAMAQPEIYRFWALCDLENKASARVLEKAGLEREGILRRWMIHPNVCREPRDCYIYSYVR